MAAQIPGFKWSPADDDHYRKGRSVPIRGGAQHYTRGTNSLAWLTKTSEPPVSATFLVHHEPTLEDRGWQMVALEDTPWTTAFANAYTASIEYEHHPEIHDSIPEMAYTVLAQSWIDIAEKVNEMGLGEIPLTRAGIRGHKEWVGNPHLVCPDGVFVDRIVSEMDRLLGRDTTVDFSKVKTQPDPWRDHLGGNPYGRDYWIPDKFVENIVSDGGFMPVGFVTGGAFQDGAQLVQYFERARLELNEDGSVTRGLVGLEALAVRNPDRLP